MKTFDQRYDAWIHGRLPASEAEAFERELDERVPTEEEMAACLEDTARLADLFRGSLPADPVLPNADFLNSSIMRQILEDQAAEGAVLQPEKPVSFIGRLVGTFRALRAPQFALPIAALLVMAVLGVNFMRPGADPVSGGMYAKFQGVESLNKSQIWAGQVGHGNVLWVDGLDWIPGDAALLN